MALPTGTISMSQVNTELGRSSTASISLNETAVRNLAGVASGAISMNNLRGKSAAGTFTPDGGASSGSPVYLEANEEGVAEIWIDCTADAVWNWTRTGSTVGTATTFTAGGGESTVTGATGISIRFRITAVSTTRVSFFTVSATSGGNTRYWSVTVSAFPSGSVMTL